MFAADNTIRACTVALLLACAVPIAAHADSTWTPLFDGQSLNGWRVVTGTAPFVVENGAIVGTTRAGTPNSFLATEMPYDDFVLELEVRQEGEANSGVQIRSASDPAENNRVYGYQVEIDPSPRHWTGGIYEEARRGWLYPMTLNPAAQTLYKYGEWNHFRIEAIGPSLRTWINGVPVSHVVDEVTRSGFIALQVHSIRNEDEAGRRTAWRNLRIRKTDTASDPVGPLFVRNTRPNDLSETEKLQGWRLLWDGRTTQGWGGTKGAKFPASDWKIDNGELIVTAGTGGADLLSKESFAAFELQLEFKLTEGANSGVKYFVPDRDNVGLEFQLLDNERHPDARAGINGNRTLASLYDVAPPTELPPGIGIKPRVGMWQHARVVSHLDGRVEHWVNGIKVLEYARGSSAFHAQVAQSKFKDRTGFGLTPRGHILLQDHGDEVHFRSIKIRGL